MRAVLLSCALAAAARASLIEHSSFSAPFKEFQVDGSRAVPGAFRVYGSAVVNEHFIRLTPDRQSKRGAVWARQSLGSATASATLRARISGQAKRFFGDGMALWIAQTPRFVSGDLHGLSSEFVGIGVIMDTFKNTETIDQHRDISIVWNDGTRTREAILGDAAGCDAVLRFHEDRADFDVTQAHRVKVEVNGRSVKVLVDEREKGQWRDCAEIMLDEAAFGEDWLATGYVGLTATTGELADNHDVLSLQVFSDSGASRLHEATTKEVAHFDSGAGLSVEERLSRLEAAVDGLMKQFEKFDHEVEHSLVSVDDHIRHVVGKIEGRESASEGRISEIERKISKDLGERLMSVESKLTSTMRNTIGSVRSSLESKLTEAADSTGGWKLPFAFVVLLAAAVLFGMYRYHRWLRKQHLL